MYAINLGCDTAVNFSTSVISHRLTALDGNFTAGPTSPSPEMCGLPLEDFIYFMIPFYDTLCVTKDYKKCCTL